MTKTLRTMDFTSVLFGAAIVILAITLYIGSATITKSSIDKKERMNDMDAQIDYLTIQVQYLEDQMDQMKLRMKSKDPSLVFEKILDEFLKHGQQGTKP